MRLRLPKVSLEGRWARTTQEDGRPLRGAHTRIIKNEFTDVAIWTLWGREDCCFKVFKQPWDGKSIDDVTWGPEGAPVVEATIIQNLAAMQGIAPRVYGLTRVVIGGKTWLAQVTDYAEGEYGYRQDGLRASLSQFQAVPYIQPSSWDMNEKNAVGGRWTDWGWWRLVDLEGYEEHLGKLAYERAAWGSRSEPYQSVLGLPSQRDFQARLDMMNLCPCDMPDKTLLDVGCNLGNFVRWADESGARRAVGFDRPGVAEVAQEVANWCRCWNVDIIGFNAPRQRVDHKIVRTALGWPQFDVVLALAVERQIGYGRWLWELTAPGGMFYLEGHVPDQRHTYEDRLKRDWDEVEFLGMTRDHGPRPLFRCRRSE